MKKHNLKLFKSSTIVQVRNYEVDWQGIVHNANYLHYFEVGRVKYLNEIGASITIDSINSSDKILIVRNEINYYKSAKLLEDLLVLTRIPKIGNSSFVFESVILDAKSNEIICDNLVYHAWLNSKTNKPIRVPERFRKLVRNFEKKLTEK